MNSKQNPFAALRKNTVESARSKSASDRSGRKDGRADPEVAEPMIPGEILHGDGDVEINAGMPVTTIEVANTADRPVQIGSHYHFAEVNDALEFDRKAAWGKRLNVLSGGAVRFEPGAVQEVELVPIQGRRIVPGLRGICGGSLDG